MLGLINLADMALTFYRNLFIDDSNGDLVELSISCFLSLPENVRDAVIVAFFRRR